MNAVFPYKDEFKKTAVQKYLSRGNRSIQEIADEVGTTKTSIYNWTKLYAKRVEVVNNKARSPEDFSAVEKMKSIIEYASLSESDKGEYLRKKGLTSQKIELWQETMFASCEDAKPSVNTELKNKLKALEKELRRKNKALAETAALLVLQKKIHEIWQLEDEL